MKKRKIFFLQLLIIITGVFIADVAIGKLLKHFYFNIHHGEQGRTTYAIESTQDDILILGSSRALHHYVPAVITDSLHESCYNAGKDKQGLFFCQAILNAVMLRHPPRRIILDISPDAFEKTETGLDELSVLLPYYHQHPEIRPVVNRRSKWEGIKTFSSLYCYNSLLLQIVFNNISNEREANYMNGYVPLNKKEEIGAFFQAMPPSDSQPDNQLKAAFEELISTAKRNNCQLIVVVSPIYFSLPNSTPGLQLAEKICKRESIPYFNYSQPATFINNATLLFSDKRHLNNSGAVLFSQILCSDLLKSGLIKPISTGIKH